MASKVILDNISVKNNPALFQDSIELDITFTALDAIPSLLEWRVIYVGSAKNEEYDQVLEEFEIGPIPEESTMKFTVECAAPDFARIPRDELICNLFFIQVSLLSSLPSATGIRSSFVSDTMSTMC